MFASPPDDRHAWYARIAAAITWFALLLQLWLSIEIGLANGNGVWQGVWTYFAFFTILTNLLAASALATAALRRSNALTSPAAVTGIAACIALVGIAYNLLLRNTWNPQGLQLLADVLLHDIDPLLFLGWWWLTASSRSPSYAEVFRWARYPVAYFAYAMARGALEGFYPYPFIDVPALGMARVIVNALAILIGFFAIAAGLTAVARFRARR
jgi:hypothetical protein